MLDEEVPPRGAAAGVRKAHLETEAQRHRCRIDPGPQGGAGAKAGDGAGKSHCMRPNRQGELVCRFLAPWPLREDMTLEPDPKTPSYMKWFPVRTHTRLNCIMQRLIPTDAGDEEMFRVRIDGADFVSICRRSGLNYHPFSFAYHLLGGVRKILITV